VLLHRTGQPDSTVTLPDRDLGDLLAEELRRLDADQPYADALGAATSLPGLADRPAKRTHIWRDPANANGDSVSPDLGLVSPAAEPAQPVVPPAAATGAAAPRPEGSAQ
jgi:hypothetical protein